MGIFDRLKNLIRANSNDQTTKTGNSEKMLNLFIEDVAEQCKTFSIEVNKCEAHRLMILDQIKTSELLIPDWHNKAKSVLSQNREDLARQALENQQKEIKKLERLKGDLVQAEKTLHQMKEQQTLLQKRFEEAKGKRDDLIRRSQRANAQKNAADTISGLNAEDLSTKFEHMKEKVLRKEVETLVANESVQTSLDEQFDQLERVSKQSQVDDALAKLKVELEEK